MKITRFLVLTLTLVSLSVSAQSADEWDWKIAPYLWATSLDGRMAVGPIDEDIEASFGDLVSDLEIGGSIYTEFGKDKHAVHFDYTYLRLRPDPTELETPPWPPNSELATKITARYFEPAYNYRWNGPKGPALVLGARMTDLTIRLSPSRLPSVDVGPSWWDYFVGIKSYNEISNKWDFAFYGTVGTGGADLPWTLQTVFGRRYSNDNRLLLGFRAWNADYSEAKDSQTNTLDLTYYGFMVGYEFN